MTPINCIDIGANLTHKSFRKDLPAVLESARSAGVEKLIVTGTSPNSSREAAALAAKFPGVLYSTAGVHPHDARHFQTDPDTGTIALLEGLAAQKSVVAIGECGLDFNRDFSPHGIQTECFVAQLELAARTEKPVFLHERDAHEEFLEIITSHRNSLAGGVVHCFTGTREAMRAYLDLNLHMGITGWICDERRGKHLREIVREIPANRLMIETDAPFLAPRDLPQRIQRNEPKYLPHILNTIAESRGESPQILAGEINKTTVDFFGL